VIRAAVLALALMGCASTIHVESAACDLDGEINTGTVIECDDGAVRVERKSVSDTTNGLLGVLLRALVL
jgi:hypothetical protein